MIDPHWYVNPNYFFDNTHIFDQIQRKDYKIYVGEYACNSQVGGGNMLAALSEAAFISGMERNSDIVTMASYAPLFENRKDRVWPVNLIWMDNQTVLGRSSYYVQKMYAENMPDHNLETVLTGNTLTKTQLQEGLVGFGTWGTQAEYKDVVITDSKGKTQIASDADWNFINGDWAVENGVVKQKGERNMTMALWKNLKAGSKYSVEAKARKTGGNEGFFVYFGMSDDAKTGYVYNIGGWNNTRTALENVSGGQTSGAKSASVSQKIDSDKWYDLKLVVDRSNVELFLDGVSIQKYEVQPQMSRLYSIAGYDESAGEIVIKVVNAEETPFKADISLKNCAKVEKKGKVIYLYADSLEDENSFDEPTKISPVISDFEGFSNKFKYTFKPRSFTILRIKAA
jgi:alpha-L-arabinofuranosidase